MGLFGCCFGGSESKACESAGDSAIAGRIETTQPTASATGLPTRRTASVKACLGIEHVSFVKDVGTNNYYEAITPKHASISGGGSQAVPPGRLSRTGATTSAPTPPARNTSDGLFDTPGTDLGSPQDDVLLCVSPALPDGMRRPKWSSEDYVVHERVHQGHSSTVFKAQCQASSMVVAVKVYRLSNLPELQRLHLFREIKLHAALDHPNVISFYAAFKEGDNVFIINEFVDGGDLLGLLFKYGGKIPESAFLKLVAVPLLSAVHHMHIRGILHRDIKPENVLFTADRTPKLADLGLAIDMREERPNSNAGTLDYMAPEVLSCPLKRTPEENKDNPSAPGYGPEADAWALGAVTFEMLVGQPPFKGFTEEDTTTFILTGELRLPKLLSEPAKDFINRALARNRLERLAVADMLEHPWIKSAEAVSSAPEPLEVEEPDFLPCIPCGGVGALGPLPDLHEEGDSEAEMDEDDEILTASRTGALSNVDSSHRLPLPGAGIGSLYDTPPGVSSLAGGPVLGGSRHGGGAFFGGPSRLRSTGLIGGAVGAGGQGSTSGGGRQTGGVGGGSRPESSSHGGAAWRGSQNLPPLGSSPPLGPTGGFMRGRSSSSFSRQSSR